MGELKYCRVCLVTDAKMYSLDITSNDSIGLIYSHLAQIRICDRNQHVCFECANLLHKYQNFKSKCLRAHNILSKITVNSTEITKEVIQTIDRKENKLESNLLLSPPVIYHIPSNTPNEYFITNISKANNTREIQIKKFEENHVSSKTTTKLSEKSDDSTENNLRKINNVKEPKAKRQRINKEVEVSKTSDNSEDVDIEYFEDCNDTDFIEDSEENTPTQILKENHENVPEPPETKEIKLEAIESEDSLSDNEPLSKNATKISLKTKRKSEAIKKKKNLNIEFFDDYATVTILTVDDARKELLSRKESNNYIRSPFKCDHCYKGYEVKTAFENHMKRHSLEIGEYECELCHLRFPKHINLCKHMLNCHKRKFSCKLCTYVCYCMYQARNHVTLHKGKKYPCKDCGEIFSLPNSLLMHKHKKHLSESVYESICEFCGDIFGTPKGLFLHNIKIHRTDENSKLGPNCEECGVHFSTETAWKRHLVLSTKHTVSNGCKYCGERFVTLEELKRHKRTHHSRLTRNQKRYVTKLPSACAICNKWLSTKAEFDNHMISEHPQSEETKKLTLQDQTPFVCEVCGQTFKQQCILTYHQRKHTGERPYSCGECGKTFQLAGALSIHRAVHARRRHKCALCARAFSFKSALNKHMKMHLGIRPHKCTICDKSFIHMCDLKLHIKYVHDKVPWPKKKTKRKADDNATYLEYN